MATTSMKTWRSQGSQQGSTPPRCMLLERNKSSGSLMANRSLDDNFVFKFQRRFHNTSSPMFLLLAPQSAHTPLEAPDEYLDMFAGVHDHNRRVFSAMVAAMDVMVGRVIGALRESGLYENSLVVFVSDNGAATMQALFQN